MSINKRSKNKDENNSGEPIFVERPLPSEDQVKLFEQAVEKEERQEEIDDNLSEIYRNKSGEMVDVSHIHHEKGSVLVSVIKKLFVLAVVACLGYGFYFYFFHASSDAVSVDLAISAPEQVKSGEEFSYTIHYQNHSKFSLNSLQLELKYPDSFVVSSVSGTGIQSISTSTDIVSEVSGTSSQIASTSTPASTVKNYFNLPALPIGGQADIVVKGRLFAEKNTANMFSADLSYEPGGLSSEFKKEAVASVLVNDLGFDLNFEYANVALVNEENEIDLVFSNVKDNFLNDFELSFSLPENISLSDQSMDETASVATSSATSSKEILLKADKTSGFIWQVHGLNPSDGTYRLPIYYKVNKKIDDNQTIMIKLSRKLDNGNSYVFAEKNIDLNVANSNLNLTLIANGNKNDSTANFGDSLNYSLNYANKSDSELKDVVIMAVLKSDFLDWNTFKNKNGGIIGDGVVTWTKEQIPALADLAPGEEGVIDFSINIRPYSSSDLGKSFTVQSYGQFNVNNRQGGLNDSKSNNINIKINSDLNLTEKVLYFDDNNTPVGSGPLPPKVNQKTAFKVYWTIENNLHELGDTRVVSKLPDYVSFDNNNKVSNGDLSFDNVNHAVIWNIGALPISTYQATAEFNISITPTDSQRNSLLVLIPGSIASAIDQDTKSALEKKGGPKTTKLEDDNIASLNNSGLVQ